MAAEEFAETRERMRRFCRNVIKLGKILGMEVVEGMGMEVFERMDELLDWLRRET